MTSIRPESDLSESTQDDANEFLADPAPTRSGTHKPSAARNLMEWVVVIAGAVMIALLVKTFVLQAFFIPSGSMLPTFEINDRVLVNKLSYHLHGVNRGDIVVFEHADSQLVESKDLIKRVIGIPGDSVVIDPATAKVQVNGQPLDEPYLPQGTTTVDNGSGQHALHCTPATPCKVPPHSVFVMGDNRPNSRDSRFIGYISEDDIVGRAFVRVWPFSRFGGL